MTGHFVASGIAALILTTGFALYDRLMGGR